MVAPAYLPQQGAIQAYYALEDVNDGSGNGYNLTNTGTVTFTSAKFLNGANYGTPNTTKWLGITNDLGIQGTAITMSCWVKLLAEIGTGNWYMTWQGNNTNDVIYVVRYEYNAGTRRLYFYREGTAAALHGDYYTITLGTSDWYNIVLTYDTTNITGYVNGIPVITPTAASGTSSGNNDTFRLGVDAYGVGVYIPAIFDETTVWNVGLSSAEVVQVYSGWQPKGIVNFFFSEAFKKGKEYFKNKSLWLPDNRLVKPELGLSI